MPPPKKLLDQVRDTLRTKQYSPRTEEAYIGWIRRFILFHHKRHPAEMGSAEVNAFLTDLAVKQHVAPWHRNKTVRQKAAELKLTLQPLPGYSPDLNPIEGLWKRVREDVTQHHCHTTMRELFDACKSFVDRINKDADAVIERLWPKFELDPAFEKLLVS